MSHKKDARLIWVKFDVISKHFLQCARESETELIKQFIINQLFHLIRSDCDSVIWLCKIAPRMMAKIMGCPESLTSQENS